MKRPHKGVNEKFVGEVILSRLNRPVTEFGTGAGPTMAYMICTDPDSKTLFTAHLDTVHHVDGPNPVLYDEELQWMWKEDGTALGADDGAGIWVLYNMIEANIPGSYLFTVGEERGGVGAKWVADNEKMWLGTFQRAITFDRKATTSVITHQMMGRCCSDVFGKALAAALTEGMDKTDYPNVGPHRCDDGGVYTDTAEFTSIIPECTNVSAGYKNEHSGSETLDVGYLIALLETALHLKWEELPTNRDPSVIDPDDLWMYKRYPVTSYLNYGVGGKFSYEDDKDDDYTMLGTSTDPYNPAVHGLLDQDEDFVNEYRTELYAMSDDEIYEKAQEDPIWAGDLLLMAKYDEL